MSDKIKIGDVLWYRNDDRHRGLPLREKYEPYEIVRETRQSWYILPLEPMPYHKEKAVKKETRVAAMRGANYGEHRLLTKEEMEAEIYIENHRISITDLLGRGHVRHNEVALAEKLKKVAAVLGYDDTKETE